MLRRLSNYSVWYRAPEEPEYKDYLMDLYPEYFTNIDEIKQITFQVTEDCCLACTYCYQLHKTTHKMTFDTIKPFLDKLYTDQFEFITTKNTKAIVLDFIGGEPLLELELIEQISEYSIKMMTELHHVWLPYVKLNICSNGVLYFTEKFQRFLNKYKFFIFLSISIDGNKELHDSCRIDHNGNGSYDIAVAAAQHFKQLTGELPGTKMTLSPSNITYLYVAMKNYISLGYKYIHLNCVYEEGWEDSHATIMYEELKKLADYIIDNDLYNKVWISLFSEEDCTPLPASEDENWCGGVNSSNIAIDYKGDIYWCIRYMESSLNGDQPPLIVGTIQDGIGNLPEHKKAIEHTSGVTRSSQSTEECFNCPIAKGCGWCSAYNYQKFGTVNKRATFICCMHKARALANAYYWKKLYTKFNIIPQFCLQLPYEKVKNIISEEEYNTLI